MASLRNVMESERRIAKVLAIGTANPSNIHYQPDFPDFYFNVTNSQHMTDLKDKFQRLCKRTEIKKRHMQLSEETIKDNPNMGIYGAPSLNDRLDMLAEQVPKLGKEAALKAIKEWGQPMSRITHLVFVTLPGMNMPGPDIHLVNLLGLTHTVQRHMIYQQGCGGGGNALRLAKDLAEKNVGSRVLVVCSELWSLWAFQPPSETRLDSLMSSAVFADGAAAVIVGADPVPNSTYGEEERPLFQIVAAVQTLIYEDHVLAKTRETGLECYNSRKSIENLEENAKQCVLAMLQQEPALDTNTWTLDLNDFFYVVHSNSSVILRAVEKSLNVSGNKLKASWNVLSEYGNMGSSTLLFVLDEMRKKSEEEGKTTTGDGFDWGLVLALGPGITLETLLLRSYTIGSEEKKPYST